MNENLLSIIVPAYNVAEYIDECILSIVHQTDSRVNIIIVNDGSTDSGETDRHCSLLAKQYPRQITYIKQENKGLGGARNTGLQQVRTKYVTFLDSDDWIMPNYVERFYEEIEKVGQQNVDIIFTLPVIYNEVTKCCEKWHDWELYQAIFSDRCLVSPKLDGRILDLEVSSCRKIYRMDFLKSVEFKFQEQIKWEDVVPHYYLLNNADMCMGIPDIGFYYRINTGHQITTSSGKGRLDVVRVFAQLFAYLHSIAADRTFIISAMKRLVGFSTWCIGAADVQTRKELIDRLSILYNAIPKEYFKIYKSVERSKKIRLFIIAIKSNMLKGLLYDYYTVQGVKSIVRRGRRLWRH